MPLTPLNKVRPTSTWCDTKNRLDLEITLSSETQIKALSISNAAYLLSFSISPTVQKISTKTCGYDVIKLTLVILSDFLRKNGLQSHFYGK